MRNNRGSKSYNPTLENSGKGLMRDAFSSFVEKHNNKTNKTLIIIDDYLDKLDNQDLEKPPSPYLLKFLHHLFPVIIP